MNVFAINGSARLDSNTAGLLRVAMSERKAAGIETELMQLVGQSVRGCTGCGSCARLKNRRCIMTDDTANDIMQKMFDAEGIETMRALGRNMAWLLGQLHARKE
ncbi:MAG: NAD(P)H-dependent oxidoreductase [Candidatus Cryosericum sp.]|nr:NAD(P)H-dependent oxidoreductase [bacterium]